MFEFLSKPILCLLLVAVSGPVFAAGSTLDVARAGKDPGLRETPQSAVPNIIEKYEYYEVRGETEKDLRCQMTENGCTWNDGKRYDSITKWNVKWDYDYDRRPNTCAPASFRAAVEVTFRFPKWVHPDTVPPALARKWDSYMKNLILHERGHRDIAVTAAAQLTRSISRLSPAATCPDIDREVKALCREHMKKLNDDQKAYDTATTHGAKQGAIFP